MAKKKKENVAIRDLYTLLYVTINKEVIVITKVVTVIHGGIANINS